MFISVYKRNKNEPKLVFLLDTHENWLNEFELIEDIILHNIIMLQ